MSMSSASASTARRRGRRSRRALRRRGEKASKARIAGAASPRATSTCAQRRQVGAQRRRPARGWSQPRNSPGMTRTAAPDWRRMKRSSRSRKIGSTGLTTAPTRAAARKTHRGLPPVRQLVGDHVARRDAERQQPERGALRRAGPTRRSSAGARRRSTPRRSRAPAQVAAKRSPSGSAPQCPSRWIARGGIVAQRGRPQHGAIRGARHGRQGTAVARQTATPACMIDTAMRLRQRSAGATFDTIQSNAL